MKNITKLLSVILLTGGLVSTLTACGNSTATKTETKTVENPKTVTIGYQSCVDDKLLVKAEGWFEEDLKKIGVTLKYVSFDAGRDINNAMVSKAIDFGDLGDPPVTIAVANKIPYEAFWIDNVIGDSEALVVKNKANVKSIKELKGKKIGTTISSTSHYSLLSALKLEGLSEKNVQIIDLKPADILAAWKRGDIDAAYIWQPTLSKLYEDGTKLISSKDLASKGSPTSNINVVRKEFGEKYPQIVSLYIKSLIRAQNEFKTNPEGAGEKWATALEIDKASAIKQANEIVWLSPEELLSSKYLGTSSKKGDFAKSLKAVGDFLVDQKALTTKVDVSEYEQAINPKYLEDALK